MADNRIYNGGKFRTAMPLFEKGGGEPPNPLSFFFKLDLDLDKSKFCDMFTRSWLVLNRANHLVGVQTTW